MRDGRTSRSSSITSYGNRIEGWMYLVQNEKSDVTYLKVYGVLTGQYMLLYRDNHNRRSVMFRLAVQHFSLKGADLELSGVSERLHLHLFQKEDISDWTDRLQEAVKISKHTSIVVKPHSKNLMAALLTRWLYSPLARKRLIH